MKRNPHFILHIFLLLGDLAAIVLSFGLAYFYRTHFDSHPYVWGSDTMRFIMASIELLPVWIIVLFASGVYDPSVYPYRPRLYWRLLIVSAIGIMAVLTLSYFQGVQFFPARLIAMYAFLLSFVFLVVEREVVRTIWHFLLRRGRGVLDAIVIGNNDNTRSFIDYLYGNLESGYRLVAVVAAPEFVPQHAEHIRFRTFSEAVLTHKADVVIQTDENRTEKVYFDTVDHHMSYMYIPSQKVLLSHMGEMRIMGSQPVITVRTTPLIGWARFVKRIFDLVLGVPILVLSLPIMLITALALKLSDPHSPIVYKTTRLSRFGKHVGVYKFRSMKNEFNGLSPEAAFEKMGKPELATEYRMNGDQLDDDPRVSRIGKFIRKTSIDELPQLFNVIRGDISLVGPRALVPNELNKYHNRNLILSVKSGITGLAQVSGRRSISFEERRALDIYYIQNWSLALDSQIIIRTIASVLLRRGAK